VSSRLRSCGRERCAAAVSRAMRAGVDCSMLAVVRTWPFDRSIHPHRASTLRRTTTTTYKSVKACAHCL
jgi:predicted metalloprotease